MTISQKRAIAATINGEPVEHEIWEIIDLSERPDLAVKFRAGAFDAARGVNNLNAEIDAPLLIYRRDQVPQVLFIPARTTNSDENDADRERLVGLLFEQFGEACTPGEGLHLAIVLFSFLPLFLAEDKEIQALAPALQSLLRAQDVETISKGVMEAPQLLEDSAIKAFALLATAIPQGVSAEYWGSFLDSRRQVLEAIRRQVNAGVTPALGLAVQHLDAALARYEHERLLDDLKAAFAMAQKLVETPGLSNAPPRFQAQALQLAAKVFLAHYVRLGDEADLTQARSLFEKAANQVKEEPVLQSDLLNSLAIGLVQRFYNKGDIKLVEEGVVLSRQAVSLTPDGDPQKPGVLNTLATLLSARFDRLGDMKDLNSAIKTALAAVNLTPTDHPDYAGYLNNLAVMLSNRFDRRGDIEDIEAAIGAAQTAVSMTPDGHPRKPGMLNTLANRLAARFDRLGQRQDLEAAIEAAHAAADLTPDGHPYKPGMLDTLATLLSSRFKLLGDGKDLEAAIGAAQAAVNAAPAGHPSRPKYLDHLAATLSARFNRFANEEDFDVALSAAQAAVSLTPEDHPDRPGRLNILANRLSGRFDRLGELKDLDAAIRAMQAAVNLTLKDNPDRPGRLSTQAIMLSARFNRLGEEKILRPLSGQRKLRRT